MTTETVSKIDFENALKRIAALEEVIKRMGIAFKQEEPVRATREVKPARSIYTDNGVRVGDKTWVAWVSGDDPSEWAVHEAKMIGLSKKVSSKSHFYQAVVYFPVDDSSAEIDPEDSFPFTPEGKAKALEILNQYKDANKEKILKKAILAIRALSGALTLDHIKDMSIQEQAALAGIVGLSPFKDLAGLKGVARCEKILKAATKLSKMKKAKTILNAAKQIIADHEKNELKKTEGERKKAEAAAKVQAKVDAEHEARVGRKMSDGGIPVDPRLGDFVRYERELIRIKAMKDGQVYCRKLNETDWLKIFTHETFVFVGAKNGTPIWELKK